MMRRQYVLLILSLCVLGHLAWKASQGTVSSLQMVLYAAVLLVLLLISRYLRFWAESHDSLPGAGRRLRHGTLIHVARTLIGEAEAAHSRELEATLSQAMSERRATLILLRKTAKQLYPLLPAEEKPEKFKPDKMSLEELEKFLTHAAAAIIVTQPTPAPVSVVLAPARNEDQTLRIAELERQLEDLRQGRERAREAHAERVRELRAEIDREKSAATEASNLARKAETRAAEVVRDKDRQVSDLTNQVTRLTAELQATRLSLQDQIRDLQAGFDQERARAEKIASETAALNLAKVQAAEDQTRTAEQGRITAAAEFEETLRIEREIATEADEKASEAREETKAALLLVEESRKRESEVNARALNWQRIFEELPPFVLMRDRVRQALSSAEHLVAFVRELGSDPDQRRQGLLALLTFENASTRTAVLIDELASRANAVSDTDEAAYLAATEVLDPVLEFLYEGLDVLALSFLEILENESMEYKPQDMSQTLACTLFGFSLSSPTRWNRFARLGHDCWKVMSVLPRGVRLGMAEHAVSADDFLMFTLGTKNIRNACRLAKGLTALDDHTLRMQHGLQGSLQRANSAIKDPLGLRRRRWIIRGVTLEQYRKLFRFAADELSELYKLSSQRWRDLLKLLINASNPDSEFTLEEMEELLGFDPTYVLALLNTQPETLARYQVDTTLEPFATMAELSMATRKSSATLGVLEETLEAYIYADSTQVPRHRSDVKTRRARLEALLNLGDRLVQAASSSAGM